MGSITAFVPGQGRQAAKARPRAADRTLAGRPAAAHVLPSDFRQPQPVCPERAAWERWLQAGSRSH